MAERADKGSQTAAEGLDMATGTISQGLRIEAETQRVVKKVHSGSQTEADEDITIVAAETVGQGCQTDAEIKCVIGTVETGCQTGAEVMPQDMTKEVDHQSALIGLEKVVKGLFREVDKSGWGVKLGAIWWTSGEMLHLNGLIWLLCLGIGMLKSICTSAMVLV